MKHLSFLFLCFSSLYSGDLFKHLKPFENTTPAHQIEGIDAIYVINLEKRPEKLKDSLDQLSFYDLIPCCFSAIDGKKLTKKTLQDIGLEYKPGMKPGFVVFDPTKKEEIFLSKKDYGKICFYPSITMGAVGCSLSHLSILKQAYDAGSEIIWVLEDDFILKENPEILKKIIEEIDLLVGKEGWDILFTDDVDYFHSHEKHGDWRPDLQEILTEFLRENISKVARYKNLSDKKGSAVEKLDSAQIKKALNFPRTSYILTHYPDCFERFRRISGRWAIHSMIVKRSAMEKILGFIQKRGVFLPYDDELGMIPNLKMFNLKDGLTAMKEDVSDTNQ